MGSVQMCGAIASVGDLAILFAAERHQCSQPIRKFQAVRHYLAELAAVRQRTNSMSSAPWSDRHGLDLPRLRL